MYSTDGSPLSGDGNLSWELTERFSFLGETIAMRQARGKGINKPRQLDGALSITTAYRGPNSQRPYEDSIGEDGYPRYKYESTDPYLSTNRAMRAAMNAGLPLAYFLGVRKAVYRPVYPVYVIGEDPNNLEFALSFARHDVGIDLRRPDGTREGLCRPDDPPTSPPAGLPGAGAQRVPLSVRGVPAATSRTARCRPHHRRCRTGWRSGRPQWIGPVQDSPRGL